MNTLIFAEKKTALNNGNTVTLKNKPSKRNPENSLTSCLLFIQKTIGNRAVLRMMNNNNLKATLKTGHPKNKLEQEADRLVDNIMQKVSDGKKGKVLQTKSMSNKNQDSINRQKKSQILRISKEEEEESVHTKRFSGQIPQVDPSLETRIRSLRSNGQPLPKSVRNYFEPRFGRYSSDVRIHTDMNDNNLADSIKTRAFRQGEAATGADKMKAAPVQGISDVCQSLPNIDQIQVHFGGHDVSGVQAYMGGKSTEACQAIGTKAYTEDNHVAFKKAPDLHTAAHEAAHVVQQGAGVYLEGGLGKAGGRYEQNFDEVANAVVKGESKIRFLGGDSLEAQSSSRLLSAEDVMLKRGNPYPLSLSPYGWILRVRKVQQNYPSLIGILAHAACVRDGLVAQWLARMSPGILSRLAVLRSQRHSVNLSAIRQPRYRGQTGVPPRVHLKPSRYKYSHPLDWDKPPYRYTPQKLKPTPPPGWSSRQTMRATLRQIFHAHRTHLLSRFFRMNVNLPLMTSATLVVRQLVRLPPSSMYKNHMLTTLTGTLARANQYAMVETLNVGRSGRYQPTSSTAYCNVYAPDLVTAMGGYLPRVWWRPSVERRIRRGERLRVVTQREYFRRSRQARKRLIAPIPKFVNELGPDGLARWLRMWGRNFGWRPTRNPDFAQNQANSGKVVILLARSSRRAGTSGYIAGHVSVILPETRQHRALRVRGRVVAPLQSQAGARGVIHKYRAHPRMSYWLRRPGGSAWVFYGRRESPIATPEEMGLR